MRIAPQSTVTLYSGVDIDFTSGIEIAFSSLANQNSYFASKLAFQEINCTVVKKTGRLRLEAPGSTVKNCNYLSFINPSFENKRIYAMILDYNYINNECTEISYQIDFWQTWMFDINFEESGIVRQYLNETDYGRASTNPYDKRIYAFQTPEALPHDKALEKYNYEYILANNNHGISAMIEDDADIDGCYPMLMCEYSSETDAFESLLGDDLYYLLMIAPIDFSALPSDAKTRYDTWANDLNTMGGFYVKTNEDEFMFDNEYNRWWSAFPHPYDIWVIPKSALHSVSPKVYAINAVLDQLTAWNATNQIIAIYAIPKYAMKYFGIRKHGTYNYNSEDTFYINTSYARANKQSYSGYTPHCQKLYTSPFSYIRVETPDGEVGEYHYEEFAELNGTNVQVNYVTFRVIATANGKPKVLLLPLKYKDIKSLPNQSIAQDDTVYNPSIAGNFNIDERIELNSFPQVPYVIDAFLAHLSASYMNEVAQNTSQAQAAREYSEYQRDLAMEGAGYDYLMDGRIGSTITGAAQGFSKAGPVGAIVGAGGGFAGGMRSEIDVTARAAAADFAYENTSGVQKEMLDEASAFLSDPSKDNPRFNDTKAAYANNIYNPGSMGDTSYVKLSAMNDFKITQVTLRDAILEKYDKYFKTYGYNFGATVGIPYVVKYTQGSNSNDELPHWEQVNGKDSTYVKTHDCHITHSMLPVAVAIEGMFNCGVRMLKGETL